MKFPTALSSDWIDFWENELTSKETQMNQEQLTKMLTISENIQEAIEVAGELWELSDFEVNALCGIVADAFASEGIKMEALI
jgi:hypothetical protein